MGLISRTVLGRVISRKTGSLTILLERGNQIIVRVYKSTLSLGSKCNVCIDNSNGKVLKVMDYDEQRGYTSDLSYVDESPSVDECNLIGEVEPGDVLGGQEIEALEFEDLECLEWESSREPEI